MKTIKQILMDHETYKKYFTNPGEYIGSKTAIIKAIRKRKEYTMKDLKSRPYKQLFRIFNKINDQKQKENPAQSC